MDHFCFLFSACIHCIQSPFLFCCLYLYRRFFLSLCCDSYTCLCCRSCHGFLIFSDFLRTGLQSLIPDFFCVWKKEYFLIYGIGSFCLLLHEFFRWQYTVFIVCNIKSKNSESCHCKFKLHHTVLIFIRAKSNHFMLFPCQNVAGQIGQYFSATYFHKDSCSLFISIFNACLEQYRLHQLFLQNICRFLWIVDRIGLAIIVCKNLPGRTPDVLSCQKVTEFLCCLFHIWRMERTGYLQPHCLDFIFFQ